MSRSIAGVQRIRDPNVKLPGVFYNRVEVVAKSVVVIAKVRDGPRLQGRIGFRPLRSGRVI